MYFTNEQPMAQERSPDSLRFRSGTPLFDALLLVTAVAVVAVGAVAGWLASSTYVAAMLAGVLSSMELGLICSCTVFRAEPGVRRGLISALDAQDR